MAHPDGGRESEAASAFRALRNLIDDLPGVVSDRAHLFSLELRRSMQALGKIVVLGAIAALMGLTAWLALWVGVVSGLVEAGLYWPWALLIVLVIHVVGAVVALQKVMHLVPLLKMPATLRRLTVTPAVPEPIPDNERTAAERRP